MDSNIDGSSRLGDQDLILLSVARCLHILQILLLSQEIVLVSRQACRSFQSILKFLII